jgi:hypothetical protein
LDHGDHRHPQRFLGRRGVCRDQRHVYLRDTDTKIDGRLRMVMPRLINIHSISPANLYADDHGRGKCARGAAEGASALNVQYTGFRLGWTHGRGIVADGLRDPPRRLSIRETT